MAALRAEMGYFATLCVMVLAIPLLLPVAKAQAFLSGLVICSQDGVSTQSGSPAPGPVHDDCPCMAACGTCHAGKLQALLPTGFDLAQSGHDRRIAAEPAFAAGDPPAGGNAIRAPPRFV